MNILSLFDGCSMAYQALKAAGLPITNYYASEIDRYSEQISRKNFPDIIRLGDVCEVKGDALPDIDLLIGGSPCQGFSFAGKQLNFEDPRSKLFFEFVRLLGETRPRWFLLENVRMKKEHQDVITSYLDVEPIMINSALVSAQNRVRLYWTNIPGIEQPEDRGIVLRDILEDDATEPMLSNIYGGFGEKEPRTHTGKSVTIRTAAGGGHIPSVTLKPVPRSEEIKPEWEPKHTKNYMQWDVKGKGHKSQDQRAYYPDGKHGTLPSQGGGSKVKVLVDAPNPSATKEGKAYSLTASYFKAVAWNSIEKKQRTMIPCEKCNGESLPNTHNGVRYRKLTPIECERLQTLPDNFTEGVSNTQRYKMIGNGFTVAVIAYILGNIKLKTNKLF